jgi:hypothetical protein
MKAHSWTFFERLATVVFRLCGRSTTKIRTVIYVEEGLFVAQCLEYDVRAQAKTLPLVIRYIILALMEIRQDSLHRHGRPFANIDPAPQQFFEMWEHKTALMYPQGNMPTESIDTRAKELSMDWALAESHAG